MIVSKGDALITVPCWWKGDIGSLVATIKFQRPDIDIRFGDLCAPIPMNAPTLFFGEELYVAPKVQELMLASFPAQFDNTTLRSSNWWMGEKYDGIRSCWDNSSKKLYTRNGVEILLPKKLAEQFVNSSLDSEVWFGRGEFLDAQRVLQINQDNWDMIRVIAFDDPSQSMWTIPFEKRYKKLIRFIEKIPPRVVLKDLNHLKNSLQKMLKNAGEGLILQKAKSMYEPGRSESLFKLKVARGDQEGLVVGISDSCQLQLPDGLIFNVPFDEKGDSQYALLEIGDVVTFEYDSYSRRSIPVNPKMSRIRRDLSWEDVLAQFSRDQMISESTSKIIGFTSKPQGFWGKNLRAMLERFAKLKKFDPLVAENWYTIRYKTVLEFKEMTHASLSHYNGSFIRALIDVFPEIGIDESKFSFLPKGFWKSVGNRRELFNAFASENGFDPLIPNNWYSLSSDDLRSSKGAVSMLRYYDGSIVKALFHLYPDIGLNVNSFPGKLLGSYKKDWEKETPVGHIKGNRIEVPFTRRNSRILQAFHNK